MTATLAPQPVFQGFTTQGTPLVGGLLYTYTAGTTTPQATYTDSTQTTPNTNPVVLNYLGQANVWLNPSVSYKFRLTDAAGNLIYTTDSIAGASSVNTVLQATSPAIVVSANSAGVVSDFSQANGFVTLYQGGNAVTGLATLSITTNNCTATVNTALNTPVAGPMGYYAFTAITANAGSAIISAFFEGNTYTAQVTITKVQQGGSGVVLVLSAPVANVLSYANGTVPSFAGINGLATLTSAGTNVSNSATWSAVGSGLTGTVNTAANTPVGGEPIGYYQVTAMSTTIATLTISAVYLGNTYTAVFTVTQVPTGYEIVSTLPTTNLFQGRIVFLTTDSQLYRYDGSAWTVAVPATAVTGTLTASQIASITAAQLTGQITTTQIANNAITTPLINAGAVNTAQLAAYAVTAGTIAVGTITATQLAANSVTATQISAGSILTNAIGAGQVTAAKIGVTQLSAIAVDAGTITAGVLENASGTTYLDLNNAYLVFNNGTYMLVRGIGFGAASNYLEWYGPTQSSASNFAACTDALAIFYLKTNGSAYFGGLTAAYSPNSTLYTGTGTPSTTTVTVPAGKNNMTVELWGDEGGGAASSNVGTVIGAGGGSGSYCRSVYSCSSQAGNTISLSLWTGSSGGNASTASAGTFSGFATMTAYGGGTGTGTGIGTGGAPGAVATGGNQVNLPGNGGIPGTNDTTLSLGYGGAAISGLYGNAYAGARGSVTSSAHPGQPAVCVVTFL
jgi:hypothetical protein